MSFTERTFQFLIRSALGIARCIHDEDDDDGIQKSISVSSTFDKPVKTYEQFKEKLHELCENLAKRMDKRKIGGCNVTVEFKDTEFNVI